MGFRQYDALKQTGLPQLLGVQAEGAAPLVLGKPVANPETVATAIRIGRPARGEQALQAAEESGGRIVAVSDGDILHMQRRLAAEGVWVEPASAAGLAGLSAEIQRKTLVCAPAGGRGLHRTWAERPGYHFPNDAGSGGRSRQSTRSGRSLGICNEHPLMYAVM
jgi:threonine synthase